MIKGILKLYSLIHIALSDIFYYIFDATAKLFVRRDRGQSEAKTVLVVRMDSVGDFILWLDAARAYKTLYPSNQYRVVLLANQDWAELTQQYSYWDEIFTIDRKKFVGDLLYRWQFLRKIYKNSYDIVLQPTFSRVFLLGDAIVRASAAKERVGWQLYEKVNSSFFLWLKKKLTQSWYTKFVSLEDNRWMELERNAHFVRALGATDFRSGVPCLSLSKARPAGLKGEYCVIVPDALWEGREWPLENFIEIASRTQKVTGWQVVFLGVRQELYLRVNEALGRMDGVNLIGQTKFLEYVNIIAGSKMVVANESSAIHIATACNVPAFAITGGGHWGRFLPYRCDVDDGRKPVVINEMMDCYECGWRCPFPRTRAVKCVGVVSSEKVWAMIVERIS